MNAIQIARNFSSNDTQPSYSKTIPIAVINSVLFIDAVHDSHSALHQELNHSTNSRK